MALSLAVRGVGGPRPPEPSPEQSGARAIATLTETEEVIDIDDLEGVLLADPIPDRVDLDAIVNEVVRNTRHPMPVMPLIPGARTRHPPWSTAIALAVLAVAIGVFAALVVVARSRLATSVREYRVSMKLADPKPEPEIAARIAPSTVNVPAVVRIAPIVLRPRAPIRRPLVHRTNPRPVVSAARASVEVVNEPVRPAEMVNEPVRPAEAALDYPNQRARLYAESGLRAPAE
jgi:hypothetical protein